MRNVYCFSKCTTGEIMSVSSHLHVLLLLHVMYVSMFEGNICAMCNCASYISVNAHAITYFIRSVQYLSLWITHILLYYFFMLDSLQTGTQEIHMVSFIYYTSKENLQI